jgi:hypothetical protein
MKKVHIPIIVLIALSVLTFLITVPRPASAQQQSPDLTVLDAWQTGNHITYIIQNKGPGSISGVVAPVSFYNALFVDDKLVTQDHVTLPLAAGQQLERIFDYQYQMTSPSDTIRIIADYQQNIAEGDEQNNIWETIWQVTENLPDLIVESLECGEGNKLSVTIKNIGTGPLPAGWSALGQISFNGNTKGTFGLQDPTFDLNGGIALAGGSATYILPWEISEPTLVACAVDITDNIQEDNEQNNIREEEVTPTLIKLPDLVIEDIEYNQNAGSISYTVKNIGEGDAAPSFTCRLSLSDPYGYEDSEVQATLKSGETYILYSIIPTQPEEPTITVDICADIFNEVEESNEQNNCLEKTIQYEVQIPLLLSVTSGPSVTQITRNTAVILWTTNAASNSAVRYDYRSGKYGNLAEDPAMVTDHLLELKGLEPGVTYHYRVESQDPNGTKVNSRDLIFKTPPAKDGEKPSLSIELPETLSGISSIRVTAQDNIGVDRVVFLCDGKPAFTDYTAPFNWDCDASLLTEGDHLFSARAFDIFGNMAEVQQGGTIRYPVIDPTAPSIAFVNPRHGDDIGGSVRIEALIEDTDGHLQKAEMYIDGVLARSWVYTPFSMVLSDGELEIIHEPPLSSLSFTYLWDTGGLEFDSMHLIEVKAWDDSDNYNRNSVQVRKPPLEALLPDVTYELIERVDVEVTRNVVAGTNGNWFEVWLNVRNTGTATLDNLQIRDACIGFQAIALSPDTTIDYKDLYKESQIMIITDMGEFSPGETWTFLYHVVPVLFSPYNPLADNEYVIGLSHSGWNPQLLCMHEGRTHQFFIELPYTPSYEDSNRDGLNDLDAAFKSADYLIVTSEVLLRNPDYAGVDMLLQKAATLAREKRGVLGYWYPSPSSYDSWRYAYTQLKMYISPGTPNPEAHYYQGYWASRLGEAFSRPDVEDAYLLLIGEWDVIPSMTYNVHTLDIRWTSGDRTDYVTLSDNFYADTVGSDNKPDLIVGRIVGDTPQILIKPIEASLDVMSGHGFDRASAAITSGYEDGSGDSFVHNAVNVAGDLSGQGVGDEILHWSTLVEQGWGLPLTDYDAFALGDVDGDGIDEVIIAKDEESKIYIYEAADRSLVSEFACEFTRYDGLATGNLDRDSSDEIIIARDDNNTLYAYKPNGDLIDSCSEVFDNWDMIAVGDVLHDSKDEIMMISESGDYVRIYRLIDTAIWGREGWELHEDDTWELSIDFTRHDGFAVGNVLGDDTTKDEIIIARNDNNEIYIYRADGWQLEHFDARFTPYDGFAVGDVDEDDMDEMVVIIDEDDKISVYQDNGRYVEEGDSKWKKTSLYSRFFDDWFHGIRYTASDTQHDGFAIGTVIPGENAKACILHIRDGWGSFEVFASTWDDADRWANRRLGQQADDISFLTISGHGNSGGASPIGCSWSGEWGNFVKHPFVFSMSCLSGNYRGAAFGDCLFDHGAAVFIGATEVSARTANNETVRKYFDTGFGHYWDIWGERAGKAFNDYKRYRVTQGNWWKFWVYEYNYYGDPKFPFGG